MANFFRYIGAAAPALNASARTALDIAREMREGPLREAESQGRQALTQQRMEQEKYEFEQKKKEDTEMDAPMDATLLWQGMSGKWTDEKQTYGKKMLQQQGIVDERGFTTRRKMEQAKKMIMLNKEATKWFQEAEIEGERMVGTDLMGKVSKAEESGDPGKIDEARSNFRKWNDKYQAKTKGFDQFNKTQTAYYLRDELQKKGILTKEMDAALVVAWKGGEGIDDVLKILKEIKEKPDTNLTEAEILSLPDTDPRKVSYVKAKKEMATKKPDKIVDWGYGQKKNLETGEISKVPTAPKGADKERAPWQIGKDVASLRKELNALPDVKEYNNIKTKSSAMEKALEMSKKGGNMVAVDQALISLYNKLTDPQSVVRESEYARTQENQALINRITGKMDKWMQGGAGITQDEREALVAMAREINSVYNQNYQDRVVEYRGYAKQQQLDPDQVATVPKAGTPAPSGATQQDVDMRNKAIKMLQDKGEAVTEERIKWLVKQLK